MAFHKNNQKLLFCDDEKADVESIITFESKSTTRNSYEGQHYIAISPDGTQIVTLNTETCQLKLCEYNNLTKLSTISCDEIKDIDVPTVNVNWSLTISNKFYLANGTVDILIAISCFDDNEMRPPNNCREEDDVDICDNMIKNVKATTWIISFLQESRIFTSIDNIGGIVRFLYNDNITESIVLVLINAHGITKLEHRIINGSSSESKWINFFLYDKSVEKFQFPIRLLGRLRKLPKNETYTSLIQQMLAKDRIVMENRDEIFHSILMYRLNTNSFDTSFRITIEKHSVVDSCFAISSNEYLFAYCHGANIIAIHLMENGLEVAAKEFREGNVKILFVDFVQDDSKLLIVIEEENYNKDTAEYDATRVIVVWDLFSGSDKCVRKINDTNSLFPAKHEFSQRLANSSGNLIKVTEDGNVISILNEPEIIELLNSEHDNGTKNHYESYIILDSIPSPSEMNYHFIYDSSGELLDSKSEKPIIKNPEPWKHNKYYKRVSTYMKNKFIQLIIGESTVQVWRRRKSGSSFTRTLEYIWTNNQAENNENFEKLQIRSLKVSHGAFSLMLTFSSEISPFRHVVELEWPEKVNIPVDACRALEFLNKKKNTEIEKQYKFEKLVQQVENIIKKFLIKKCGLWKMLDIRYDIMANLIRGNCTSIIKSILTFKLDNGKDKYVHTPRSYTWNKQLKETDLEIAIKCSDGNLRKDTIIVKYLLEYYSNKAIENVQWMCTISKAIPLFYEYRLESCITELLRRPCFGAIEIHTSRAYINNKDVIKGNHKKFHALEFVSFNLVKLEEYKFSIFRGLRRIPNMKNIVKFNDSGPRLISKIYIVPLPDFTVYPEYIDDKQESWKTIFKLIKLLIWPRRHIIREQEKMSPFVRMIMKENSAEIYENPSIAAIIDFKWKIARKYFIRSVFTYYAFALDFVFISSILTKASEDVLKSAIDIIFTILFYWLGFYLLNTERIRLMHNGWRKYHSFFSFFNLFSVILPLLVISIQIHYSLYYNVPFSIKHIEKIDNDTVLAYQSYTILNSFTVLTIWMEIFLLFRYFEIAGTYVYTFIYILQQIIPFLKFIVLIVLGFGHSMYVLLNNTDKIGITPDGSNFQIYDSNGSVASDYTINQVFQEDQVSDNYFSNFISSAEAVFLWTAGRWDQLDQWNFWPVEIYSVIGSLLLVTILQNMLIAIMSSAYDNAKEIGKHAVLKYRAELIADYETLEDPFGNKKKDPPFIIFTGKSEYIDEWIVNSKRHSTNMNLLNESNLLHYDDYDDDDDNEQEVPLSLYWLVDKDKVYHKKKLSDSEHPIHPIETIPTIQCIQECDCQDTIRALQAEIRAMEQEFSEKLHTIEENINYLVSLLQHQK